MLDDLEAIMIGADIGVATTNEILKSIRDQMSRKTLRDPAELRSAIKEQLRKILNVNYTPPNEVPEGNPFVILIVGVNGVGKTTTIGKLAHRFNSAGKKVMLCASDTFRAAAVEQLEIWANRADVPVIKQKAGADPSAVLFDALQSAKARKIDYVIADTAGRLHTKHNLMAELEKMTRIAKREVPGAPHEVLLVLDATTGQNGLTQAREFTKSAGVTGLVLTKLDGTAKGGVVTAIAKDLKIPIRVIGVGFYTWDGIRHAEIIALEQAGAAARGATLYTSLEPCSHQGRTPPCAKALIDAGVARVVASIEDPNPEVNGSGVAMLREAG